MNIQNKYMVFIIGLAAGITGTLGVRKTYNHHRINYNLSLYYKNICEFECNTNSLDILQSNLEKKLQAVGKESEFAPVLDFFLYACSLCPSSLNYNYYMKCQVNLKDGKTFLANRNKMSLFNENDYVTISDNTFKNGTLVTKDKNGYFALTVSKDGVFNNNWVPNE